LACNSKEREKQAGLLYRKDYASIDPRKFVKSTPNDGLAAGLGQVIFKSSSVFYMPWFLTYRA